MTTTIKVIKSEEDYKEALALIEILMAKDPEPNSEEGEKLALLATLVQDYESKKFPESLPDPIEAIRFRMEQQNLKPVDLVPYLGSRSRVSEILSGERPLTLEMVRALEAGLGIPAKVLIKKSETKDKNLFSSWSNKLIKEMEARGYFGNLSIKNTSAAKLLENFFATTGSPTQLYALLRQSSYRSAPTTDRDALAAWSGEIIKKAKQIKVSEKYKDGTVNLGFMQKVVKFSAENQGPILAQEYLKKHGIILVIEPHLPKTRLDGATLLVNKDFPIIGLTLRHDRLDNFWFTLMHELAHIALHFNQPINLFYDELDEIKGLEVDNKESDADKLASEALVPANKWEVSPARIVPTSMAAKSLAQDLGVHIAIVAGKIRYEGGKYIYLNNIVGQSKIREFFPNEKWYE